ncbi:MAG: HepT-like ribonuclease domain-containing protein [Candidatus Ranarchaeia archaeon]
MKDAIQEILLYTENKTRKDLSENRLLSLSLVQLLEIVGEAASNLSDKTRKKYSLIPWRSIIDMRNRLIHGYFDIDLDIVWNTVRQEIPDLLTESELVIQDISNRYNRFWIRELNPQNTNNIL